MLIEGPGTFEFVLDLGISHEEFASVSSLAPATVEVFCNDVLVDRVYVANGATHTWWSMNPLVRRPEPGDRVKILIVGPASMRLDWPFKKIA